MLGMLGTRRLQQQVRDLEGRMDQLAGFVAACALAPTGAISDSLRQRARELAELFDVNVRLRVVEPEKKRANGNN